MESLIKSFQRRLKKLRRLVEENRTEYTDHFDDLLLDEEAFILKFHNALENNSFSDEELSQWMVRANDMYRLHRGISENGLDFIKTNDIVDWSKIDPLLKDGEKILAIKEFRSQANTSLKTSKERVDERKRLLNL